MARNSTHRPKLRSLVGIILFVVYVTVYVLIAMAIGARYLAAHGAAQFIFYVVAGLAWVPGAMLIVSWMARAYRTD
jgi:drug/metabolite transporter superfamily protein YnfA